MFRKILVAHDLPPEANHALYRGAQMAHQFGAELVVQHSTEGPYQHLLTALQGLCVAAGVPDAQILIRQGRPSGALLQSLAETDADLLITGPHHPGRPEAFRGSNLERLAREVRVPMLMVRQAPLGAYQDALLALDSSVCACNALKMAYQLLPADGRLEAVHIHDPSLKYPTGPLDKEMAFQQLVLQQLIDDELAQCAPSGLAVSLVVRAGRLAASLDEVIHSHRPELLVLGQHSRSRLSEALLGSLPAYYLRHPQADLLLVK
jgi:nucleotide-binding universal stress UspA family protein